MKLLNIDQNAKTVKGRARGYMTGILYLKPNKKLNNKINNYYLTLSSSR